MYRNHTVYVLAIGKLGNKLSIVRKSEICFIPENNFLIHESNMDKKKKKKK